MIKTLCIILIISETCQLDPEKRHVWARSGSLHPRMRIVYGSALRDLETGSNPERGADLYPPALANLPASNYLYNFDNVNII